MYDKETIEICKTLLFDFAMYEKNTYGGTIRPQKKRREKWEEFLNDNSPSDEITEICLKEFIPLEK